MKKDAEKGQVIKAAGVEFSITEKEHCLVEYQVKADASLVKQARQEAAKTLAKNVSLPGFRKGKAPTSLIEKKFSGELTEQWKKSLADIAFKKCQESKDAKALYHETQITFDMEKIAENEDGNLRFVFETLPNVPEIDPSSLELIKVGEKKIGKKEVDQTIEDLRQYFVSHSDIDRGVNEGDVITINVDIIEKEPAERALSDARFEVKKEKMASWMFELIMGMKKGEIKEGISQVDESASDAEKKAMPPKKVRVELLAVQAATLPELDDSFAEKLGCKTMDELRENLTKLLQKQTDERIQDEYRKQINEQVLENFKFDLPKSMVGKEVQFRVKQLMEDPYQKKRLSEMSADERKKTIAEVEEHGEKAIRLFFISQKIIQDQKIKVSPAELQVKPSTPLEALFTPNPYQSGSVQENAKQQESVAMSKLLLKKAEDYLISNTKVVEGKKKAAAKADSGEEKKKPAAKKAASSAKKKTTKKAAKKSS